MQIVKLTARFNPGGKLPLVLSAVGIGILVGSWSATREDSFFGSALFVPAVPLIMAVTALVLAIVFRKGEPKTKLFFIAAMVLVSLQLLAVFLMPLFSYSEKFALGVVVTVAEGISSALLMFIFLISLSRYSFKEIAVSIAAGYLLVNLYDGLFLVASEDVRLLQRLIGLLVVTAFAGILLYKMRDRVAAGVEARGGQIRSASDPLSVSDGRPETIASCVLLACFVSVLLLIQGVYSQITGLGGTGNTHLFDMVAEIYVAGVRAAVLSYCLITKKELSVPRIAACASVIWLVGIPAVTFLWGTDAWLVGSLMLNSGRYILLPLVLIFGVQMARHYPNRSMLLIFLMIATVNSCYVSRFAVLAFIADPASITTEALLTISLFSMWVIACAIPAFVLVWQRLRSQDSQGADSGETAESGLTTHDSALTQAEASDPVLVREIAFYQRFEALSNKAQLTERETEVLREAMHGYSIDNIAKHLNLSSQTIKTYLSRAYSRLGVTSKQAVLELLDSNKTTN